MLYYTFLPKALNFSYNKYVVIEITKVYLEAFLDLTILHLLQVQSVKALPFCFYFFAAKTQKGPPCSLTDSNKPVFVQDYRKKNSANWPELIPCLPARE
jgi:hypothetical protein